MRKVKSILSIVLVLCMLLSTIPVATAEETVGQDNEAPVIHLDTLELLNAEGQAITNRDLEMGETVRIRFKVTDASDINSISVFYNCNGDINGAGTSYSYSNSMNSATYDKETGIFEGEVTFYGDMNSNGNIYYGLYEIDAIRAHDAYGNETTMTRSFYGDGLNVGTFTVIGDGYVADDKDGPVIDHKNIQIADRIGAEETVTISVPITDASKIYSAQVEYGPESTGTTEAVSVAQLTYNENTQRYEGELRFQYLGNNQLISIRVTDANKNQTLFVNKAYKYYPRDYYVGPLTDYVEDDASAADVFHGDPTSIDSEAPVVDLSSLSLQKHVLERDESATLSLKISDNGELQRISLSFIHARFSLPHVVGAMPNGNGVYTFQLPSSMYGQWKLARVEVIDTWGNATIYHDNVTYPYYGEDAPAHTDLSAGNYYVGVIDETTGVSVSDASMGDNTTIAVTENELSGDKYSQMLEEGCTAHAFYDVSVSGDRGSKTSLLIPAPDGLDEGDAVRVVHLKADGTTENLDTTVQNGLVAVTVSEFSPFLLETGFTPTYQVSIDACMGAPFNISAPPPLGNDEPSSYIGEATLSVEDGTTLAEMGINVWHDSEHLPYFEGWGVYTWDPTMEWWVSKKDSDGNFVILDTATMLGTPITEDVRFEPRWKTFAVYFEGNGGTFDMDMSDIHIGDDMAKSGWYTSYLHSFEEFVISDIKNGSETFYGWDVYEQVEDPNNPGYNLLNPVEGPISTEEVLARTITYNVVYRANWTGEVLNVPSTPGGSQNPDSEPVHNIIISSNNDSPFKLTDTDGNTETFPGYFGLNSNDFTDEFSNFSDLGLASIDLDDSTPFACWEVFRPVFDDKGNIVGWDNEKDEYGNNRILPAVDLILTWPIKDGVKFVAQWNAGGNQSPDSEPAHTASPTLANVKAATCTTEGYTGDKVCANCGEVLEKGKAIEKLAHTEVAVAGKAPTCTETGLTEGKKCSVCATVTVEQTVIATVSHTLTKVEAVAPTYTAAGNIEHYACACGALFADAEGKTATTAEAVKLAQLIKIEETKAEVSTDAVDTAIKEAETTGSITIDLVEIAQEEAAKPESGSGSDTTTKPAPVVSSAALPVASLQKVAEISEETTLTVNMTEVSVTMDAKTLAAVAEQSAGETVTLKVEKVETETLTEAQQAVIEDKEVAVVISASLISNNVAISNFNGGSVTISIPFTLPEGAEGSDFQIYYVADDGTMTAHDTEYLNGYLVFSTGHFSDYVVVNTAKSVDPNVPNTGDNGNLMFFTTMLLIAAAGVYLTTRKMRRA